MPIPKLRPVRLRRVIVVRNSSFGLLWSGQLLSATGTWLMVVAVPVYVFHLTHSARDTGLATVAEVAPTVIVGPLAGVLVDRWSRRPTMVASDLARAASVLLLIFFTSPATVWILLASVFAQNVIGMFFTPAYQGLVPFTVGRGTDLEVANAWSNVASGITRLAGAPLGGVVYAALGFRGVVALDAASYVTSAACIALMPVLRSAAAHRAVPARSGKGPLAYLRHFTTDLRAGTAPILRSRLLAAMLTVTVLFLAGNGALTALLVPYIVADLGGSAATVGGVLSALGAGYLISAYVGRKACSSPHLRAAVIILLATLVATFAGFFNTDSLATALIFIGLAGIAGGAYFMLQETLTQRFAPDHLIGRVTAMCSTAENGATLAGALFASLLEHSLGLTLTLNLAIAIIAAAAIPALLLPDAPTSPKQSRSALSTPQVPAKTAAQPATAPRGGKMRDRSGLRRW